MSDPRNVAHDKKVKQEKEHHHDQSPSSKAATPEVVKDESQSPGDAEKSAAVLSKLKEMEFHSRANIETLAGLTLTIEDELKQKEFSEPIGALYSAQDGFQTQIAALIQNYEAKSETVKPA